MILIYIPDWLLIAQVYVQQEDITRPLFSLALKLVQVYSHTFHKYNLPKRCGLTEQNRLSFKWPIIDHVQKWLFGNAT